MMTATKRYIILVLIGVFIAFLWKGVNILQAVPQEDKGAAFPAFSLSEIVTPSKIVSLHDLKGRAHIVHIWATWCGICIKEHDAWMKIQKQWPYPLIGVVYRDDAHRVINLLDKKGSPYISVLNDDSGKLGLDLGLRGTPETYIVDKEGVIQFHHVGAIDPHFFEQKMLPLLQQLDKEPS